MSGRPDISRQLGAEAFRSYYYLKEELTSFCRASGLPVSGGKPELTDRIAHYLSTGEILPAKAARKSQAAPGEISEDAVLEPNFICSEKHRAFFASKIGNRFSFNVAFQRWLKNNAGKTYAQAIEAYYQILEQKEKGKSTIDAQFEYNAYIRAFFEANKGASLSGAIKCWKYKNGLPGHNCYENSDLTALRS
jgi:hypothetical protein